jgi:hypothetical protein
MKKIKFLAFLTLSTLLLTSCGFRGVIPEIDEQLERATVLTTQSQQETAINNISRLKLQPTATNAHVADFTSNIRIGVIQAQSSGFIDYIFDTVEQKTYVDVKLEGIVNINAKVENDLLNANVSAFGFDFFNTENQSFVLPKQPLNELLDLSFITALDRSIIKQYRTATLDYNLFKSAREIWALNVDSNYINETINNDAIKFLNDPEIVIVGDSVNNILVLVLIRGRVRINNTINADAAFYSYILP